MGRVSVWKTGAFGVGLLLGAAGCGELDPNESVYPTATVGTPATVTIGKAGGELSVAGVVKLSVPRGALDSDLEIAAEPRSESDLKNAPVPEGARLANKPYALLPHGTRFSKQVEVELDFESRSGDSRDLRLMRLADEKDDSWELVEGQRIENLRRVSTDRSLDDDGNQLESPVYRGKLLVKLDRFSVYAVAEVAPGSELRPDESAPAAEQVDAGDDVAGESDASFRETNGSSVDTGGALDAGGADRVLDASKGGGEADAAFTTGGLQ